MSKNMIESHKRVIIMHFNAIAKSGATKLSDREYNHFQKYLTYAGMSEEDAQEFITDLEAERLWNKG